MNKYIKLINPDKDSHAFWLSFIVCLFCCCIILFAVSPITGLSRNFGAGNDGYIQLARNIAAGNGYVFEKGGPPVFHRPPLYPIFLTSIAFFPENLQRYVIIIPQSILVGFIGMMIFKIARLLYNQNTAKIALLLFLSNPWVYWNAKNPMTAILQTFLYILFAYFTAKELFINDKFSHLKSGFIIGIIGAVLALTHGAMLPLIFLFYFIMCIIAVFRKVRIVTPIYAGIFAILLITPWTYRNWIVFERFIPVAGGGGLAFFNGNVHWDGIEKEPQKKGESYIDASVRILGIEGTEKTLTHWMGFKDIQNDELANQQMIKNIKEHKVLFIKKFILNAIEYYFPAFTKSFLAIKKVSLEQWVLSIFHLYLWILAVAGIFYFKEKGLLLIVGILIYCVWYFPFATGFIGHSLYTLGTIPFLSILAAAGIFSLHRHFSHVLTFSR